MIHHWKAFNLMLIFKFRFLPEINPVPHLLVNIIDLVVPEGGPLSRLLSLQPKHSWELKRANIFNLKSVTWKRSNEFRIYKLKHINFSK